MLKCQTLHTVFNNAAHLLYRQLGEAEHEDFCAGILEDDGGFGINARAFQCLNNAPAKTLVYDGGANL